VDIEELVAREAIRDIVARYNSLGDSGRIDAMMTLFAPDAVLEVPGRAPVEGATAIGAFFGAVAEPAEGVPALRSLHHHTATLTIELTGRNSARGRCYFSVYTQDGLDHWGRYTDEYRRVDGHWLFAARRVRVDGVVPGGWADSRD